MASIDSRYPGKFRARISIPDLPRLTKTFSSRKEAEDWAAFQENLILKIQAAVEKKWCLAELAKRAPISKFHAWLTYHTKHQRCMRRSVHTY